MANKEGYTILRWNEHDDHRAKFIMKDNKNGKMTLFTPGEKVSNLTWADHDLTTEPEFQDWDDFENEQVEDLRYMTI